MSVLPVRSTANTPAEHVDDHNAIHDLYNTLAGGAGATDSPDSTGSAAIALGFNDSPVATGARASGAYSISIGGGNITDPGASATADDGIALGRSSEALHARSVAVGYNATTTAVDQIVLGGSPHQVVVPGTLKLGSNVVTSGVWTDYTPTLTQSGAVTKTVTYARFSRVGRIITVQVLLTLTGAGTVANPIIVGLPIAAVTATAVNQSTIGSFSYQDTGTALYTGTANFVNTTSVAGQAHNQVAFIGQAPSFAAASGDFVSIMVTYEAAS